jgi:hypothetical protein
VETQRRQPLRLEEHKRTTQTHILVHQHPASSILFIILRHQTRIHYPTVNRHPSRCNSPLLLSPASAALWLSPQPTQSLSLTEPQSPSTLLRYPREPPGFSALVRIMCFHAPAKLLIMPLDELASRGLMRLLGAVEKLSDMSRGEEGKLLFESLIYTRYESELKCSIFVECAQFFRTVM